MKSENQKGITEQVIGLGVKFDEIEDDDLQYMALIMLMTGYLIENIKEECYEVFLQDFAKDAKTNLEEFKKFSENPLANTEAKGNA